MAQLLPLGRRTPFGILTLMWSPWPASQGAIDTAEYGYAARGGYIYVKA